MSIYHFDPFSGLAGDMFLGACLDLGMPLEILAEIPPRLKLPGVGVEAPRAARGGFAGRRFRVLLEGVPVDGPDPGEDGATGRQGTAAGRSSAHGRQLPEIRNLVEGSGLEAPVTELALRLFHRLAEAEAKAHGIPPERVHFHEVGAIDSIVDLVGAAAAIVHLAPDRVTSAPANVGGGSVASTHGHLPAPAPATVRLLEGLPVYGTGGGELLTPTGAVLLAELVDEFCELPAFTVEGVGYGLGRRELEGRPNAFRLWRGSRVEGSGEVLAVECEIDDLPGEGFGFLMERLYEGGALDVYFTPIQMKKNRPGTLVTALCRRHDLDAVAGLLLVESGSLGCRYHPCARFETEREASQVVTPYGAVRVKRAQFRGTAVAAAPEFEDCRRLARQHGVPWRQVYAAALAALAGTRS